MTTFLITAYKDRERVKALGARWDAVNKRWFVPEGLSLVPFAAWLPAADGPDGPGRTIQAALLGSAQEGALEGVRGVSLSALLNGVADALSLAYRMGVWTVVEVSRVDVRGAGHVYLEVAERDAGGSALAQARAMIWARTAQEILPAFEHATGAVLAAGGTGFRTAGGGGGGGGSGSGAAASVSAPTSSGMSSSPAFAP